MNFNNKYFSFSLVFLASSLILSYKAYTEIPTKPQLARPWEQAKGKNLPPGEKGKDYTPCVVPNGHTAGYHVVNGIKIFHLTTEEIEWNIAKGLTVKGWGINGSVPGPLIEACEDDHIRIYVTNNLAVPTSLHWHGILLPNGMDGVAGVTQPPIPPGQTFAYDFYLPNEGTFLYHSHLDTMVQEGMGLIGMIVVHKREPDPSKRPNRDFAILLHEAKVTVGTSKPNVFGGGFNIFTMNGKVFPSTEPLVAELGENVWIRFGNLSAMHNHPIHLHGYNFKVIGTDGGFAAVKNILMPQTTTLVPTGSCKVISLLANNPGDWVMHCHMTHHTMNQMGDGFPFTLGIDAKKFNKKMQTLIPGYKMFGTKGMKDMAESGLPIPKNSIPMLGLNGRWGTKTTFGGMANIFKVRERTDDHKDPGPYPFPKNTEAKPATPAELRRDCIQVIK